MKPTQQLHDLGQSLWLDNITRDDARRRHPEALHRRALGHRPDLQPDDLRQGDLRRRRLRRADRGAPRAGHRGRGALLRARPRPTCARAAKLFEPESQADRPHGRLGLARGLAAARLRHRGDDPAGRRPARAAPRTTSSSRSPGTPEGLPAIEESIFAGVPINVTLLFSTRPDHRRGRGLHEGHRAADRGRARPRRALGRSPSSSAAGTSPSTTRSRTSCKNTLGDRRRQGDLRGLARVVRLRSLEAASPSKGARLQRLLFASTGTKDPEASDTLYIEAFAAPDTINTMPEKTLQAFADHGKVGEPLPADGGDAEEVLQAHRDAGHRHRRTGAASFRRTAPRRSSSPGPSCSTRSSPSPSAWLREKKC